MGSREQQRLRSALRNGAHAFNVQEDPSDPEILHIRPKPRQKKKKPKTQQ